MSRWPSPGDCGEPVVPRCVVAPTAGGIGTGGSTQVGGTVPPTGRGMTMHLTRILRRRAAHLVGRSAGGVRDQRGITTAEYAVGTAAGAGLAGLAYQLLTGGLGNRMLTSMFEHVLGLIGIG